MNLLNNPPQLPMVFPSILGADFTRLGDEIQSVLDLGAEALHIDIMDGHFVPNLTMGPDLVRSIRKRFADVYLDAHLMVNHPEHYIQPFAEAGINCLSFQIESVLGRKENNEHHLIQQIRSVGCQVGVVINPPTPAAAIEHILDQVDLVLIMSVHPGFAGQKFIPQVLDKARSLKPKLQSRTRLQMDGGLNATTARQALDAGVDVIIAASALFGAKDRAQTLQHLRGKG